MVLFALSSQTSSLLNRLHVDRKIHKTYFAVVRGWTEDRGRINHALESKPAETAYLCLGRKEIQVPVGKYQTARYSLVAIQLLTGRMHQIRRHFSHLSHPIIGDRIYGDGRHNRFFRNHLKIMPLMLKAYSLEFIHPVTGQPISICSRWQHDWHQAFDLFGSCPYKTPIISTVSRMNAKDSYDPVEITS